jgi:hypothetical protein
LAGEVERPHIAALQPEKRGVSSRSVGKEDSRNIERRRKHSIGSEEQRKVSLRIKLKFYNP